MKLSGRVEEKSIFVQPNSGFSTANVFDNPTTGANGRFCLDPSTNLKLCTAYESVETTHTLGTVVLAE